MRFYPDGDDRRVTIADRRRRTWRTRSQTVDGGGRIGWGKKRETGDNRKIEYCCPVKSNFTQVLSCLMLQVLK